MSHHLATAQYSVSSFPVQLVHNSTTPSSKHPPTDSPSSPVQSSFRFPATLATTVVDSWLPINNPPVQSKEHLSADTNGPRSNEEYPTTKRRAEFPLPAEDDHPPKKVKAFTTVSAQKEKQVEERHSLRMLQLARATREAFAAEAMYRRARVREIDVMRLTAEDEYEEAAALLKQADAQIEEIRHFMDVNGIQIATLPPLNLSPVPSSCSEASFESGSCGRSLSHPSSGCDTAR